MPAYELGPKILSPETAAPYRRQARRSGAPLAADLHPGSRCPGLRRADRRGPGALGTGGSRADRPAVRGARPQRDAQRGLRAGGPRQRRGAQQPGTQPVHRRPALRPADDLRRGDERVRSLLAGARPQPRVRGRPERHPARPSVRTPPRKTTPGTTARPDRSTSATSTPPPTAAAGCSRARSCSRRSRTTSSSTRRPTPCSTACGRSSSNRRTTTSPRSTKASPTSSRC